MFDAFSDTCQDSQDLTVRRFNLTSSSEFHSAILPTKCQTRHPPSCPASLSSEKMPKFVYASRDPGG